MLIITSKQNAKYDTDVRLIITSGLIIYNKIQPNLLVTRLRQANNCTKNKKPRNPLGINGVS